MLVKRVAKERVACILPCSFVLFDLAHALAAKSALLNVLRVSQPFSNGYRHLLLVIRHLLREDDGGAE